MIFFVQHYFLRRILHANLKTRTRLRFRMFERSRLRIGMPLLQARTGINDAKKKEATYIGKTGLFEKGDVSKGIHLISTLSQGRKAATKNSTTTMSYVLGSRKARCHMS